MKKKQKKSNINKGMFLNTILNFDDFNSTNTTGFYKISVFGRTKYICLMSISGIDIFHYNDEDEEDVYTNFSRATMSLRLPHKYVFSSAAPYFEQQKEFLNYKQSKSENSYVRALLNKKEKELENLESNHKDRLAYLIVYSEDLDELIDSCYKYINCMLDTDVMLCPYEQAAAFFVKYLCFDDSRLNLTDRSKLSDIMLPDTITFDQSYFKVNDNYVTIMSAYSYPANLNDLELARTVSVYNDIVITLDVEYRPKMQVIHDIKQSLTELNTRYIIRQNVSDDIDTATEFEKLQIIYQNIMNGNEQILYGTLRFIVTDKDLDELNKKVKTLSDELEGRGISTFVPINEMKNEYWGMCDSSNTIGTPLPLEDTYSRQFPFYYQSHTDLSSPFMGYTATHGVTCFNPFFRNGKQGRNSYDLLAFGVKGGGKSVTLKALLQNQLIVGNKVMVIDIESEYQDMAKMFDGQVIKMNTRSTINPLQMRITIDAEAENSDSDEDNKIAKKEAVAANYASEISRMCTFINQFNPSVSDDELSIFRDVLVDVFKSKGITDSTDLSGFSPVQFPIFSDVLSYLQDKEKDNISDYEYNTYKKLSTTIKQLCKGGAYGSMFDNYTNVNINDSNLIVFDVKIISEMDNNVYQAQLFNILSLMWSEICKNLTYNRKIINEYDRRNIVCLIDEAHRFISTRNPQVTEFIEKLLRRSRKYDAGLWFASQSILDFIPSGNTEQAEKIKVIFQLVQYKIILKQSSDSIDTLHDIFGQFTHHELTETSQFSAGEMLMSISGGRHKLHCYLQATDSDLLYIGNAQDRAEIVHKIFHSLYNDYTDKEYGQMLYDNKDNLDSFFISIFIDEIYDSIGFKPSDSKYLYDIIRSLAYSLADELMQKAKEN